jgi:hypothetical protein
MDRKGYRGKGKSGRRTMQSELQKENKTLGTNFLDVRDIICGQR